jgi:hypothetical protein
MALRRTKWTAKWIVIGLLSATLALLMACFIGLPFARWLHKRTLSRAERFLADADELAEQSNWRAAVPLYKRAELMFHRDGNAAMELYAKVSQLLAQTEFSTQPMSDWLAEVNSDLALPAAQNPKTRLRVLEIKGQIENNYDATLAYKTWTTVEQREHLIPGGQVAFSRDSAWVCGRKPGYQWRNASSQSSLSRRVRICRSKCAPHWVHCIC